MINITVTTVKEKPYITLRILKGVGRADNFTIPLTIAEFNELEKRMEETKKRLFYYR